MTTGNNVGSNKHCMRYNIEIVIYLYSTIPI
jgi:hypothetical protein